MFSNGQLFVPYEFLSHQIFKGMQQEHELGQQPKCYSNCTIREIVLRRQKSTSQFQSKPIRTRHIAVNWRE
ncbi:hypothetical protein AAZX31_19G179200 [Glycine max]